MVFFSLFGAAVLATTAYLQAEAKWWMGLLVCAALVLAGIVVSVWLGEAIGPASAPNHPVLGVIAGLFLCAPLIGVGSISSLFLRRKYPATKVGAVTFCCAFPFLIVLPYLLP
jgi:hypothetical protein